MSQHEPLSLSGRTAVVTGAGRGIGRGIAILYARHGADVVILEKEAEWGEDTASEIRSTGGSALAVAADVTRSEDVERGRSAAEETFGRVDILVNNVGGHLEVGPFLEQDEAVWDELYRHNLRHMLLCSRAFAPMMRDQGDGGAIINISSIEGFRALPGCAAYTAFKSAISGLTKSLAMELAPYRIRVSAIAPETTETEQIKVAEFTKAEYMDYWSVWNPMGRVGRVEDTANAALYLASDMATWVTGETLHVNGGALAAGGFYRIPGEDQRWTLAPVFKESGLIF